MGEVRVERSVVVAAPPEAVYAQVVDFRRWQAWSPWEGLDPAVRRTYEGAPQGEGAVYAWSGNRKAGRGRMEIVRTAPPSLVEIDLRFEKPFKAHNTTTFTMTPTGGGTRVDWVMTGPQTLVARLLGLVVSMDRLLGRDFDRGLGRLKAVAETG